MNGVASHNRIHQLSNPQILAICGIVADQCAETTRKLTAIKNVRFPTI
jgi:hypothetical protein